MHMVKDENVEGTDSSFISSVGQPVGQLFSSFDLQCYTRFIWYVVLIGENTETQFYFIHTQVNSFWKFNKLETKKKGEILWEVMLWWNINIKSLSVKGGLQLLKTLLEYLKWQEVLWQRKMNANNPIGLWSKFRVELEIYAHRFWTVHALSHFTISL